MAAELKLVLATEPEPGLEGWTVAGGSWCTEHGIGVLLVVSPAEAVRGKTTPNDGKNAARFRCLGEKISRMLRQVFKVDAAVVLAPPMGPSRQ